MDKSNKEQTTIDQLKELGTYHKFKTIYGDPPWSKHQKGKLGAIQHYDLMTLEQIKQMPIGHLAADDALLFLWVTPGLMKEGIEVIESWGFRYVDEMVWDKYYLGLGQRLRHTHEVTSNTTLVLTHNILPNLRIQSRRMETFSFIQPRNTNVRPLAPQDNSLLHIPV